MVSRVGFSRVNSEIITRVSSESCICCDIFNLDEWIATDFPFILYLPWQDLKCKHVFFPSDFSYSCNNQEPRQKYLATWVTCVLELANWNFHPMHNTTFWECFMSLFMQAVCNGPMLADKLHITLHTRAAQWKFTVNRGLKNFNHCVFPSRRVIDSGW